MSFVLYMLVGMAIVIGYLAILDPGADIAVLLPVLLLFVAAPALYNLVPSRFETARTPIHVTTGAGAFFLLQGTWPFFRLLGYDDGVEIRCLFQSFFLPYAEPVAISDDKPWILIISDLPGVPSRIRFLGFSNAKTLEVIRRFHD